MKSGIVLDGGTYFGDKRLKFFDNPTYYANKDSFVDIRKVPWETVSDNKKLDLPNSDFCFIFGMKTWSRKLRKQRIGPQNILKRMIAFFDKNIPAGIPIGVLDDLNTSEANLTHGLQKYFFNRGCRVYLLREYTTKNKYDKRVQPFSIPAIDNTHLTKPNSDKSLDLYFRGDSSSEDRSKIVDAAKKFKNIKKELEVYKGGNRSPRKIPLEDFFKKLADSRFCLCFSGHGYCTFRYQEIASVGSIIAFPEYPWVVANDYEDMKSCIKFKNPKVLKKKLIKVLESQDYLDEMQQNSINNFKKYHSVDAKFNTFMEAVNCLK